jgi:hypothetical protein
MRPATALAVGAANLYAVATCAVLIGPLGVVVGAVLGAALSYAVLRAAHAAPGS